MAFEPIHPDSSGNFLVTASGQPFFWLADTAWELFHRLNRTEAEHYLETRRQQGFYIIPAVILAEVDGLHTPNANGHLPLAGDDQLRPMSSISAMSMKSSGWQPKRVCISACCQPGATKSTANCGALAGDFQS
jgi:hypothetical protein